MVAQVIPDKDRSRLLGKQALVPYVDDSEDTKALVHRIANEMSVLEANAAFEEIDKRRPAWERQLRTQRYRDWQARKSVIHGSSADAL